MIGSGPCSLGGGGGGGYCTATGFRVQPLMEGLGGVQYSGILPVHHQLNYVQTPQQSGAEPGEKNISTGKEQKTKCRK